MAVVDSQEEGTFNEAIDRFNTVVSDSQLQGPQPDSLVFKDECNYCFRTTFHEGKKLSNYHFFVFRRNLCLC